MKTSNTVYQRRNWDILKDRGVDKILFLFGGILESIA